MTNRKDLIDEAILRPGRFEVHIEIGLPDKKGRHQILLLHTKLLRENNIMSNNIDIEEYAERSHNMTGAELEALVKDASSRALGKMIDINNLESLKKINEVKISYDDFENAFKSIKPMFGPSDDKINKILQHPFNDFGMIEYNEIINDFNNKVNKLLTNEYQNMLRTKIIGASGTGKTYLSAYLARKLGFTYIKYLGAQDFIGMNEHAKCDKLIRTFNDAMKSNNSLIILDDIEIILEWSAGRYSNYLLQNIKSLLSYLNDNKMIVIINVTENDSLDNIGLFDKIDIVYEIPTKNGLTIKELL
jgi:vesicle-fusing ATPase